MESEAMKKILVTGAGGYIGTHLVDELLTRGYSVAALDRFFFGEETLSGLSEKGPVEILKKDIRDLEASDLEGIYAVCDLAALSNDPSGDINPELTEQINYRGRVGVAQAAKQAGVSRYVLSSSCSVYGTGESEELTEDSATGPLTTYARSTLEAERETLPLAGDGFSVTALRNATVFGLSRRMRFDLVVNLMTLHAVHKSQIIVMGGGKQWRPLVHVRDVARAFACVVEAPEADVSGEVFNVGLANYQVLGLAYLVRETLPFHIQIEIAPDDADERNYNVSFQKIKDRLGFAAQATVPQGVEEVYDALKTGATDNDARTSTVNWYKSILEAKRLLESIELDGRVI
jgi:nucleoside-diphosphate-sugar epimerase